jgi:hypothetical protein
MTSAFSDGSVVSRKAFGGLTGPSVRDHLMALGNSPEWVIFLGEAIQEIAKCDAAIAASRARDLSSNPDLAVGFEKIATGSVEVLQADWDSMTPNQLETINMVLTGLLKRVSNLHAAGAAKFSRGG